MANQTVKARLVRVFVKTWHYLWNNQYPDSVPERQTYDIDLHVNADDGQYIGYETERQYFLNAMRKKQESQQKANEKDLGATDKSAIKRIISQGSKTGRSLALKRNVHEVERKA